MTLIHVESINDPRLEVYRQLKGSNRTRYLNRFIAEGKRVVQRLLESEYEADSVLLTDKRVSQLGHTYPVDLPVYVVPHAEARQLVGYAFHTGVLGCGIRKASPDIDEITAAAGKRATFVACPNVQDPDNIGALIRIASAFGATAVLLGQDCPDAFSRRNLRVSMGNVLRLPIITCGDLSQTLRHLQSSWGAEVVATVLDDEAESLEQVQRSDRMVILFGNEAHGLDPEWVQLCDRKVMIPMQGGTDSLNVSVSAGIFLYHFCHVQLAARDTTNK